MIKQTHLGLVAAAALLLAACGPAEQTAPTQTQSAPVETPSYPAYQASVTTERLVNADNEPGQWMSTGRSYWEQRYSPLDQINEGFELMHKGESIRAVVEF